MNKLNKSILMAFVAFATFGGVKAQSKIPQLINFQAVARDDSNKPIIRQPIEVKLTILQGGEKGTPVYGAIYQDSTNQFGEFSRVLGTTPTSFPTDVNNKFDFKAIPWEKGDVWVKIEYKSSIVGKFKPIGTFQYLAQPYAFAAGTAEKLTTSGTTGQVLTYDGTNWIAKDAPISTQKLTIPGTTGQVLTYDGTNWVAKDAPKTFSGSYTDLTNKPADATWAGLKDKPVLANVAISGDFKDLKNQPTIPTKTSDLQNDKNFGVFMPGMIIPWAGDETTVPAGWLLCDGAAKSAADYPDLAKVINNFYGKGDGSLNSFSLPDFRGKFLRGVNYDASYNLKSDGNNYKWDPDAESRYSWNGSNSGNKVGSLQLYALEDHRHLHGTDGNSNDGYGNDQNNGNQSGNGGYGNNTTSTSIPVTQGGRLYTSTETRPVNIYVNYIIKY